jgi:hypothetical protein
MTDFACRGGQFRITRMPLGAAAMLAAVLASSAWAQPSPEVSIPEFHTFGTPTPTYPIVKPGLPPPEPRIGQPAPAAPPVDPAGTVATRVQQRKTHPNGVTISVETITYLPRSVVVAIEIFNPAAARSLLNPSGSLQLFDDLGGAYSFLPPIDNPEIWIPPASHLAGKLVFVGGIDRRARWLRLSINRALGSPTDRMTDIPSFQFSLPVNRRSWAVVPSR